MGLSDHVFGTIVQHPHMRDLRFMLIRVAGPDHFAAMRLTRGRRGREIGDIQIITAKPGSGPGWAVIEEGVLS